VVESYGLEEEGKKYSLDNMIFSTAGSIVLEELAISHIRSRMTTLYLKLDDEAIVERAYAR
jgi:shikimate kinase